MSASSLAVNVETYLQHTKYYSVQGAGRELGDIIVDYRSRDQRAGNASRVANMAAWHGNMAAGRIGLAGWLAEEVWTKKLNRRG